jgi:hypothetical protein
VSEGFGSCPPPGWLPHVAFSKTLANDIGASRYFVCYDKLTSAAYEIVTKDHQKLLLASSITIA